MVIQVNQSQSTGMPSDVLGGTSLYAFYFSPTSNSNIASTTRWTVNLAHRSAFAVGHSSGSSPYYGDEFISAASGWSTHLLVDEDSGATVFGTSGVSVTPTSNGASIWCVGISAGLGTGRLTNNVWGPSTQALRGVSSFYTPLAITGNSLFAIADWTYYANSGVSLLMFDKRKLQAGPNNAVTLSFNAVTGGTTLFTTPTVAGNSLFVLDTRGGLTAYSIQPTNLLPQARVATDFVQLGNNVTTAVSASPVVAGGYLAVAVNHLTPAVAGITVFRIDNRQIRGTAGVSWWYEWTTGTTIAATPVISNGHVYVAVNTRNNGANFYRFAVNRSIQGHITGPDQSWSVDANGDSFGMIETGGMIIADNRLIAITNHGGKKRLYSISVSDSANSYSYWRQFKFDAARTGNNTAQEHPFQQPGSGGGCFISTIK
jgi:hypothetical protein